MGPKDGFGDRLAGAPAGSDTRSEVEGAAPAPEQEPGAGEAHAQSSPAPLEPVFPDSDAAGRLVLYPAAAGGLELRWRPDSDAVRCAAATFPDGTPVVELVRADEHGAVVARATFTQERLQQGGCARFTQPVTGPLHAELGLCNEAGGWLLVARSNRLEAGAPAAHAPPLPERTPAGAPDGQPARPPAAPGAEVPGGPQPDLSLGLADGRELRLPPSFPLARARPCGVQAAAGAPGRGGSRDANAAAAQGSAAGAGSGPLSPYPDPGQPVSIAAELRVVGSAPPGSVLDLGGQAYRVGAGGRFSLRLRIEDQALLQSLLASLPGLPVQPRRAEPEPGGH